MNALLGLFCSCLEENSADSVTTEQLSILHKGDVFVQSVYLGLSSKELKMSLNENNSVITWVNKEKPDDDFGEIDFAGNVGRVKTSGQQGMQYLSKEGKNLFEVSAKDTSTRDQWVIALNEILSNWEANPNKRPHSQTCAKNTVNKEEYFKQREEEIAKRKKEAEDKKKKYSGGGMKYTAIAMANRAS